MNAASLNNWEIRKDLQKQAWGAFPFSTHYRHLYWSPTPHPNPNPHHRLFLVEAASLERAASSEDNSRGILFFIDYWFRQLNTLDVTSWWSAMSSCFPCPVVSPHKTGLGWRTSSFLSLCTLMYSAWKFSVSIKSKVLLFSTAYLMQEKVKFSLSTTWRLVRGLVF